eukprot:jgi/Ulvmu1/331/UM001_0335.1
MATISKTFAVSHRICGLQARSAVGCIHGLSSRSARALCAQHGVSEPGVWTLAGPFESQLEAKKSKFLAYAWPVSSPSEAREAISSASDPRASHNCTAFKIGPEYQFNDDGEPSGTAGRPILAAIEAEELEGVAVLVVRYFGGTKLGTGGLVRAYGGAARQCLQEAPRVFVPRRAQLRLEVPATHIGRVFAALDRHSAQRLEEDYAPDGVLRVTVSVPEPSMDALAALVRDSTAGAVTAAPIRQ